MTEDDPLLTEIADRIAERMVGTRKPASVRTSEVRSDAEGEVTVRLITNLGVVAVTLRREES